MQDVSGVGQWKINETEYFTFPQNVHDQENKTVCGNHESKCGSYFLLRFVCLLPGCLGFLNITQM